MSFGVFIGQDRSHLCLVVENRREILILKEDSKKDKNVGKGEVQKLGHQKTSP